jgi:hypothetical protein
LFLLTLLAGHQSFALGFANLWIAVITCHTIAPRIKQIDGKLMDRHHKQQIIRNTITPIICRSILFPNKIMAFFLPKNMEILFVLTAQKKNSMTSFQHQSWKVFELFMGCKLNEFITAIPH